MFDLNVGEIAETHTPTGGSCKWIFVCGCSGWLRPDRFTNDTVCREHRTEYEVTYRTVRGAARASGH